MSDWIWCEVCDGQYAQQRERFGEQVDAAAPTTFASRRPPKNLAGTKEFEAIQQFFFERVEPLKSNYAPSLSKDKFQREYFKFMKESLAGADADAEEKKFEVAAAKVMNEFLVDEEMHGEGEKMHGEGED